MLINNFAYDIGVTTFGDEFRHPELVAMYETYATVRDCLNNRVKDEGLKYLPHPSEGVIDKELQRERYDVYLKRAIFLPVTKRTRDGLVAQVFIRKPAIKLPTRAIKYEKSITISGDSLESLAKHCLSETVAMSRGALVVGYSADAQRPFIDFVETENVLTWAESPNGIVDDKGRNIEMIMLRVFSTVIAEDGTSVRKVARLDQYRLGSNRKAYVRSCFSTAGNVNNLQAIKAWSDYVPVLVDGTHLGHLPVYPIGAERNSLSLEAPQLLELAELNISHYNSSADYEENAKLFGQVTPVFTGLTDEWYTKHIQGKVMFGVRTPIPLNSDAGVELLQATPNGVALESLNKKESMMVAVGARLIEERKIRKTATEASLEDQSYHSILGHNAYNVTLALHEALLDFCAYLGDTDAAVSCELNRDFSLVSSSPEHRRLLLEEYVAGVRTFEEYRKTLRTYDTTLDDNDVEAKAAILADVEFRTKIARITASPAGSDNRTQTKQPEKDVKPETKPVEEK